MKTANNFKNLTGKKFNKLIVISRNNKKSKNSLWNCECECGNTIIVSRCNLISGNTTSCGCNKSFLLRKAREKNLTNKKFGKLIVIAKSKKRKGSNPVWECNCDCGNKTEVIQENLLNGHTKSCGCASSKYTMGERMKIHGMSNTRLYYVWKAMKARCSNPNVEQYPNYGGRGIFVCAEWMSSFDNFKEWALLNGYDSNAEFGKCTIDRINPDGNYEPSNCRWVDMKVQANNKRIKI